MHTTFHQNRLNSLRCCSLWRFSSFSYLTEYLVLGVESMYMGHVRLRNLFKHLFRGHWIEQTKVRAIHNSPWARQTPTRVKILFMNITRREFVQRTSQKDSKLVIRSQARSTDAHRPRTSISHWPVTFPF